MHQVLQRELRVETALEMCVERLVGVHADPAFPIGEYSEGRRVHFATYVLRCRTMGGSLQANAEGSAWRWFPPDGLPAGRLPYVRGWLTDALRKASGPLVR